MGQQSKIIIPRYGKQHVSILAVADAVPSSKLHSRMQYCPPIPLRRNDAKPWGISRSVIICPRGPRRMGYYVTRQDVLLVGKAFAARLSCQGLFQFVTCHTGHAVTAGVAASHAVWRIVLAVRSCTRPSCCLFFFCTACSPLDATLFSTQFFSRSGWLRTNTKRLRMVVPWNTAKTKVLCVAPKETSCPGRSRDRLSAWPAVRTAFLPPYCVLWYDRSLIPMAFGGWESGVERTLDRDQGKL